MTTTKIAFRQSIIDGSLNWYNYFAKLVFHAIILHSKTAKYHSWHDVNPNHFCFAAPPPPPILFLHYNWKEEFQTSPTCSKRLINLLVWSRETGWISPICYWTSWESDLLTWSCGVAGVHWWSLLLLPHPHGRLLPPGGCQFLLQIFSSPSLIIYFLSHFPTVWISLPFIQLHPRIDASDQAANLGVLLIGGRNQFLFQRSILKWLKSQAHIFQIRLT